VQTSKGEKLGTELHGLVSIKRGDRTQLAQDDIVTATAIMRNNLAKAAAGGGGRD